MILDNFDQEVLNASGDPRDILHRLYGKTIGKNNASKYLTGAKMHIKAKQRTTETKSSDLEEIFIKEDGTRTTKRMIELSEDDAQDEYIIAKKMGLDPIKWKIKNIHIKRGYWNQTTKNKASEAEKHTNHTYACDLTASPIQEILSSEYVAKIFEDLEPPEITPIKYKGGSMLLELPIMDLHLGKLAWGKETGEDYDLKIAEKLYRVTVIDILGKLKQCNLNIEKIVFPVGQDFFHIDNSAATTTAGTAMDIDSRWQKIYAAGVELLVWAIEQLRQIAPVSVMYVPGNHDKVLSYCAVYTLHAHYEKCKSVNVDLSPTARKYVHYGVNLIGFSHGKEGKRIEHLMQQEQPKAWGDSIYREWHLGDLHHEEAKEIGGLKIRRISSITATDAWHAEKGFRATRMCQAFIWDKKKGRQFVFDSNIDLQEQLC